MAVAAAVAGGAALLGGFMANRGRSKEAQKDRNFQERMSSTSWQRGKADMEAAGINPALAYSQGGASSPGGAMAQQDDIVTGAVSSAMQAKRLKQELKNMETARQRDYSQNKKFANEAVESAHRTQLYDRQQKNYEWQNKLLAFQIPWAQAQSGAALKYGPQAAMMQLLLNSGGSQVMNMATGGIMGSIFRNARLGKKTGANPTYPGRLSGRGR